MTITQASRMKHLIDIDNADMKEQGDPFRVLHIVLNLEIGGAQETVHTLVKYMAKGGHQPVVCTFKDGPLRQEIERLGIPVEVLPDRRYSFLALPFFFLEILNIRKELVWLIQKYRIDIVQTHLLQSLDFLVATLHFLKKPPLIYWTIQNYKFTLQREDLPRYQWLLGLKRFIYRLLYRLVVPWIDGVIAVSDDVKEAVLETMGQAVENKIAIICNSVDLEQYRKPVNKQHIRKTLGLAEDVQLMLVVAMLREQKGHRYLIDAAAMVVPRFPDLHFLLAGDGTLKQELLAQTNGLGLENNIHFLGIRKDIPDLMAGSDYFVLPSLWEGLPLALIEAMASGLPIIATEVSGSKQVVESGVTGLLIPPGDSQKLAEAIVKILSKPGRAIEMGRAAQQWVEEEYSASKQVMQHLALFRQRVQKNGPLDFERDFPENIKERL